MCGLSYDCLTQTNTFSIGKQLDPLSVAPLNEMHYRRQSRESGTPPGSASPLGRGQTVFESEFEGSSD